MTRPATIPPADTSAAPADAPSLGSAATRGMAWLLLQTLGTKIIGIAGQVALAWLLVPDEFGLVGLVSTAATLIATVQAAGLREVLIHRHPRSASSPGVWTNASFWMSVAAGVGGAAAMVALAAPVARLYGDPRLFGLSLAAALALLFNPLPVVPMALLQARMRFRLISALGTAEAVGLVGLSVLFAWGGLGAYSILLPRPVMAAGRLLVGAWAARPRLRLDPQFRRWRYLLADNARVTAARAFSTVISYGDYFVLGLLRPKAVVGVYYFAFNLSMQTVSLLAYNLEGVLFPALSKIRADPARQRQAFLSAARSLALLGVPACLLQAALAGPAVRLLFREEWHGAIPVIQALSAGMAFRVVGYLSQSLIQAQGRFGALMALNLAGAVVFMAAVTAGAYFGGAVGAALAAAAYFALEGPASMYVAVRPAGGGWRDVAGAYAVPVLAGAAAAGAGLLLATRLPGEGPALYLAQAAVITAATAALYLPLARGLAPRTWHDLAARLRQLLRRAPA